MTARPERLARILSVRDVARVAPVAPVLFGVLLGVLTWPIERLPGQAGFDPSYIAGLHAAAAQRLRFGHDILFAYGPLGFLGFPEPYYGATSGLALVVVLALVLFASILLFQGISRLFPPAAAFLLAYAAAYGYAGMLPWDIAVIAAFLASVYLVTAAASGPVSSNGVSALCLLSGLALLGKANNGILIALFAGTTALATARPDRRVMDVARSTAAGCIGLLVGWIGTGQVLADLPAFVSGMLQVVIGYSSAMASDLGSSSEWLYVAYAVGACVLLFAAVRSSRGWDRRYRVAVLAMTSALLFFTFKTGFVRMDHVGIAFVSLPLALAALARGPLIRSEWALAFAACLVASMAVTHAPVSSVLAAGDRSADLAAELSRLADRQVRSDAATATRAQMRAAYGLDAAALGLLTGETVHIDPWEAGIATAYPGMTWRPLPVFQAYQAYTSALDHMNAALLASDQAPGRILRTLPGAIDGRNPWFESPAAKLEMVCRYLELGKAASWQVLGRTASRCGSWRALPAVYGKVGDPIPLPRLEDRELLVASISLPEASAPQAIIATLFKPSPWHIRLDQGYANRLVPLTAAGPLLFASATWVGYSSPFDFGPPASSVTLFNDEMAGRAVTIQLWAVPLASGDG